MKKEFTFSLLLAAFAATIWMVKSANAASADDRIESAAESSYVFRTYLKNDNIKVDSKNGEVTMEGDVIDASHKSLAESTVMNLPGVKSVTNNLQVKGENGESNSDQWIATKVKTTLVFHRNVSASDTEVDVANGLVTLRGSAKNQAQKDLTAEYAAGVEGVRDVKNDIVVTAKEDKADTSMGEKIDDASITAQVKVTLLYHRATSALNTQVQTKNAVVTLTGKARNGAEKDLATKLASDVRGVKSVRNQMTVEKSSQGA